MDGRRFAAPLPGVLVVLLCALVAACGSESPSASGETAASSSSASFSAAPSGTGLRLVSLGDSDATGAGDEEGRGWVQRYADLVADATGTDVEVVEHTEEGLTSDGLLGELRSDDGLRDDVAAADLVVLGAGGADLNAGDDAWDAGTCTGAACYEPALATYADSIAGVAAAVAELRAGRPTVFRAITPPNALTGAEDVIPPFLVATATEVGVYQSRALRDSTCAAVREHGGECIDVLTEFNGPDGTGNAYASGLLNHDDCCYPSAAGQQRIAELLLATGTEPVGLT
jgi:lysophospholipase L1-like esterase